MPRRPATLASLDCCPAEARAFGRLEPLLCWQCRSWHRDRAFERCYALEPGQQAELALDPELPRLFAPGQRVAGMRFEVVL